MLATLTSACCCADREHQRRGIPPSRVRNAPNVCQEGAPQFRAVQSSEVDQWLCHNQLGNRTANSQNCLVLRCTRWGGVGALDHDAPGSSTYLHSE